jgi:hypothetical protein
MITRDQIVDENYTVKLEALAALRRFRDLKTWKPDTEPGARVNGLTVLANDLARVYDLPIYIEVNPEYETYGPETTDTGVPIVRLGMGGRLSIITLLHNFAGLRARFKDENVGKSFIDRQRYAINFFRKVYPTCFSRLVFDEFTGLFVKVERYEEILQAREADLPFVHLYGTQPPVELQQRLSVPQEDEEGDFDGTDSDFDL